VENAKLPAALTSFDAKDQYGGVRSKIITDTNAKGRRTQEVSMVFETLKVIRESGVLFVDIAAPPMNLLGPALVRDLVSLIQQSETDNTVKVLVFRSAGLDYFIAHVDVTQIKEYRAEAAKLTGEASIGLMFRHLSASRLVTIAQIEVAFVPAAASSYWRATCASPHESPQFSASQKRRRV
jgi:hypothetical protein